MDSLSLAQARRIALAAQGVHRPRPGSGGAAGPPVSTRRALATVDRLGLLQIDSVNVLARAHLLPLYSRLGPYDVGLLDRASGSAPRRLVETWAHVASFVPVETYPLLEWRRRASQSEAWGMIAGTPLQHSEEIDVVRQMIVDRGPLTASQIHDELEAHGRAMPRSRDEWGWNWTVAKRVLEYLFFTGEVMSARRNPAFERCYDLAERVLPPAVRAVAPVSHEDAVRALLEIGARAHGVGTLRCFKDYFRLKGPVVLRALSELVEDGTLEPVTVRGWDEPTYRHRDAALPRRATGQALLSPFDPVVWERRRLEKLFDVFYRIEIYVPAPKRVLGYYVLPFLEDDAITAFVDLKADRRAAGGAGVLRVQAAHASAHATPDTAARLAAELQLMAGWLGLAEIAVEPRGDLAPPLSAATTSTTAPAASPALA